MLRRFCASKKGPALKKGPRGRLFLGIPLKDMRHGVVSGLFGTVMAVSPLLQTAKTTLQSGPVVSLQQTHTVFVSRATPKVQLFIHIRLPEQ